MSKKKTIFDYWKAIDVLYPSHRDNHRHLHNGKSLCSDDAPCSWGNFECKRCDAIIMLEKRGKKIWPRSENEF